MESRKKIRLKFTDVYYDFKPEEFLLYKLLQEQFDVELTDSPDYLIAMSYGHDHLRYDDVIKIFWTGENDVPDFNLFDYAIGFDYLSFGDRYLRCPLYPLRDEFAKFRIAEVDAEKLLRRKFCSFVVSNGSGDPIRTRFFTELSKYKKVDSGGYYLNNVGGPVKDKGDFISQYKFNIAFENSSYPGYVTEKIMDAYSRWSVPIYWGDPIIENDFRIDTMVRVENEQCIARAIDEIIRLDNDDDAYLAKCTEECLVHIDRAYYYKKLKEFLYSIFSRDKDESRRRSLFGFQRTHLQEMRDVFGFYERFDMPRRIFNGLRRRLKG